MLCELSNRSVIKVTGKDAEPFLQGLISNDINKCSNESLLYSMLLSPQGRFLYDFFILKIEGGFLLDCPKKYVLEIISKLSLYKLRQEIDIVNLSQTHKVFVSDKQLDGFLIDPRCSEMGYRIISSKDFSSETKVAEYEELRIKKLIPDADKDFVYNKSFPLEFGANELNAIDYKKGCYVGQEVTARTNYRGVVRKKLYRFEANTDVKSGSEIHASGEKIGVALGMEGNFGLCLLNIEDYEKHVVMNSKFYSDVTEILISNDRI